MHKISIIIPVYNPGDKIVSCLESIKLQTFTNYEVLIIDDGSSEDVFLLCKLFTLDKRFLYQKIRNSGANNARNYGFNLSSGSLIYYMDQDDYLFNSRSLEIMSSHFNIGSNIDFLIFRYREYFSVGKYYKSRPLFDNICLYSDDNFLKLRSFVSKGNIPISPWDKIFKKEYLSVNNIKLPVGIVAGDINWFIEIITKSRNFKVINDELYVYVRQVHGSLTSGFSIGKFDDLLRIIETEAKLVSTFEQRYKELFYSFLAYEYTILMALYSYLDVFQAKNYTSRFLNLKWLLYYDTNRKVKQVNILLKIFGIRISSRILKLYMVKFVNK